MLSPSRLPSRVGDAVSCEQSRMLRMLCCQPEKILFGCTKASNRQTLLYFNAEIFVHDLRVRSKELRVPNSGSDVATDTDSNPLFSPSTATRTPIHQALIQHPLVSHLRFLTIEASRWAVLKRNHLGGSIKRWETLCKQLPVETVS